MSNQNSKLFSEPLCFSNGLRPYPAIISTFGLIDTTTIPTGVHLTGADLISAAQFEQ